MLNVPQPTRTLFVLLTRGCNFSCPYCYQKPSGFRGTVREGSPWLEPFVDWLREHRQIEGLTLLGGEAFLVPDTLRRLLDTCKELGLLASVITNGSVYVPWLKDYKDQLGSIQFTFDGGREWHDKTRAFVDGKPSYDVLLENLGKYISDGLSMTIHSVIPLKDGEKMIDSLDGLVRDLPAGLFMAVEVEGSEHADIGRQLALARRFYKWRNSQSRDVQKLMITMRNSGSTNFEVCNAGVDGGAFDLQEGKFYSCHEGANMPEYEIGDLRQDPAFDEKKLEFVRERTDPTVYRIRWLPKILSETLKYMLPIHVCWYASVYNKKKWWSISRFELYMGWKTWQNSKRRI